MTARSNGRRFPLASFGGALLLLLVSLPGAWTPAAGKTRDDGPSTQVVGGHPVTIDAYPFMAHLRIDLGGGRVAGCGGSLIDDRHVLTAAHCVDGFQGEPEAIEVTLGVTSLSAAEDGNRFVVEVVEVPGAYDPRRQTFDVAVLTLVETVALPDAVPIQRIEAGSSLANKGTPAEIAGWGYRRFNRPATAPDQLHAATLKVTGFQTCRKAYRGSGLTVSKATMLCAYARGRDTCQGDSGGPIVVRHGQNRPIQVGITSFGIGCAFKGIPGVYTRLSDPTIAAFIDDAVEDS